MKSELLSVVIVGSGASVSERARSAHTGSM